MAVRKKLLNSHDQNMFEISTVLKKLEKLNIYHDLTYIIIRSQWLTACDGNRRRATARNSSNGTQASVWQLVTKRDDTSRMNEEGDAFGCTHWQWTWTHIGADSSSRWVNRSHGKTTFHLTQLLTGYGYLNPVPTVESSPSGQNNE